MPASPSGSRLGVRHREVDRIRRLLRSARDRVTEGAFVLEGPNLVAAALDAGATLEALYVPAGPTGGAIGGLVERAAAAGVAVRVLAPGVLDRVAGTVTPQGVLAVCRSVTVGIEAVPPDGFVLVGIDLADPGNAGTMIRTADATGAAAVVFAGSSVDVTNPKVVRAAAGSMFHLPVVAGRKAAGIDASERDRHGNDRGSDAAAVLRALTAGGRRCLGAAAGAGTPADGTDLTGAVALVVGNEAHGLPADLELAGLVHVPMAGRAESLNVAMAAAMLCYEAARQRRGSRG